MKPLLLLQTGHAPEATARICGDFDAMFIRHGNLTGSELARIDVSSGESLPEPGEFSGVIITGSLSMVTDKLDWSEYAVGWLRKAASGKIPLFGVCYGHQLLAHAFGGTVGYLGDGPEMGCFEVTLSPMAIAHPLLTGLPHKFMANLSHSQGVLELPPNAVCLASSARDPHQIVEYGNGSFSVQFHPEFDRQAEESVLTYGRREKLINEDEWKTSAGCLADTPVPIEILRRFILLCREN
jgi:GMP synthase - Glutamine amidotransferase domain